MNLYSSTARNALARQASSALLKLIGLSLLSKEVRQSVKDLLRLLDPRFVVFDFKEPF